MRYAKGISKRKFSFQHQNFPQENEVQSEAHRLAVWWSYNEAREVGDQTLISMNGTWYLVEKFDDATCGYQVEDRLTRAEYERIYKEIKENGRSGNILSIQERVNRNGQLYQLRNSIERGTPSPDSVETKHGRENTKILSVDSGKYEGRKIERHGRRDSKSSNQSKQNLTDVSKESTLKALPNGESNNDTAKPSKSMTVTESIKFARENVTEYAKLDAEGQARIRRLIRQAKANGFTDAETRAYARVAARSGIDIVIDKEGLYLGKDKNTGEDVYADGLYSLERNKIYVNPEGTRSPARLLIHELTHAIYKGKGRLILERGAKNLTKEQKEAIWNKYFPDAEFDESNIVFKDELNAHYTEALLDDDVLLQKLCDENPTLEDKIVNFLTGAKKAYENEPTLSREAKKLYKRYKTLFDSFAEGNQYADTKRQGEERFAQSQGGEYSDYDKPITIQNVEVLRSIGRKSINAFTSEDIKKSQKWAYKFYKELGVKSPFFRAWFGEWRAFSNSDIDVVDTKSDNRKEIVNKDTGWIIKASKKVHKETSSHQGNAEVNAVKYLPYIDDITKKAILIDSVVSDKDNENSLMFHTMYAYTEAMGYPALLKLKVEELFYYSNTETGIFQRDYILQNIEEESISKRNRLSRPNHLEKDSSVISISELYEFVKQFDKYFTPAPEISTDAAKYLLNDDGTPKVFYHGTNNNFYKFSYGDIGSATGVGILGEGFYFTKTSNLAKKYGKNVMPCYLRMKNPYIAKSEEVYKLNSSALEKQGYDGVVLKAPAGDIYMVFDNTQIKSATDNIGTFDGANPDTRYALPDGIDLDNDGDERYNEVSSEYDAIFAYKSSESYKINEALRNNYELSDSDEKLIKRLDKQLKEIPTYEGVVYRNLTFDFYGQKALDDFVAIHSAQENILYPSYTSTSKSIDGYPIDAELSVHMEIYSSRGHDISVGYGLESEQEVLFERNSVFRVISISYDGKTANIKMEEVNYDKEGIQGGSGGNNTRKQRPYSDGTVSSVQQMQASTNRESYDDMQSFSERNSQSNNNKRGRPQEPLQGGQRSEIRTESGIKDKNNSDRYALPDGVEVESVDTSSSVGKKRQEYKASFKERIFTAADSIYIDTVDEYYGAEKYLRKIGKRKDADSIVQAVRASMSAAQTMTGDVQYDIFSEDAKKLGEGLSRIVKPITVKGDAIKISFNEYLMHWLNVDRMSLEEKSLARLEEMNSVCIHFVILLM